MKVSEKTGKLHGFIFIQCPLLENPETDASLLGAGGRRMLRSYQGMSTRCLCWARESVLRQSIYHDEHAGYPKTAHFKSMCVCV